MMKNFNTKLKWKAFFIQKMVFGLLALFVFPEFVFAGPLQHAQNIAIEGRVIFQNAPLNEKVDLEFELYSDVNPACVLYRDTHLQVDVSDPEASAQGYFSEQLGGGTVSSWSGGAMTRLFANNQTLTGEGGCTLTAAQLNETKRYLRIKIKKNGESVYSVLDEGVSLASVPTAMVADTLQGYSAADFFVNSGGTTDQNKLYSLLGLDFTALSNTVSGTSSNYVRIDANSAVLPTDSSDSGKSTRRLWFNSTDNALKYTDNSGNVVQVGVSGSGIQSVSGNNGVTVMTSSGVATVSASTDATTIGINGANRLQVLDGGITTAKLGTSAVTGTNIAAGAISNSHITSGALIDWSKINKSGAVAGDVGAVPTSRTVTAGTGLTGGGDLTTNRTFAVDVDNSSIEINTNKVQVKDLGITNAKINSVAVNKITSGVSQYFTYMPNGVECANNGVLKWNMSADRWECGTDGFITDHGSMTGLTDDDHTQYVMLDGRAGSQTIFGGIAASENLILDSTANVTKGSIVLQPDGGNVGIGVTTPGTTLDVRAPTAQLTVRSNTTTNNVGINLYNNGYSYLGRERSVGQQYFVNSLPYSTVLGSSDAYPLHFATNANVRTTISSDGKFGIGTTTPAAKLDVEGSIQIGNSLENCSVTADAGLIRYNSGNLQYCNGTAWQTPALTTATISSLNGLSTTSQTFAVNASGTAPAINSATTVHTLSIPLASGSGVTSGTISKTDFDNFNSKVSSSRTIATAAGSGLSGGGDLSANRSLSVAVDNSTVEIVSNLVQVKDGGITNAKIANVNITKLTSGAGDYFSYMPAGTECNTGEVLKWNATSNRWLCDTDATGGVTDHGVLTGLADDDHTQYVLLAGRTGGQNLRGGNAAGNNLTLESTAHGTKGNVIIQPTNGNVGIGTTAPGVNATLDVHGQIVSTTPTITGNTVNFANGNHQVITALSGNSIALSNMVHGGSYTVVITDASQSSLSFTGCGAVRLKNGFPNGVTGHTIVNIMMYTIASVNTCYITWSSGW